MHPGPTAIALRLKTIELVRFPTRYTAESEPEWVNQILRFRHTGVAKPGSDGIRAKSLTQLTQLPHSKPATHAAGSASQETIRKKMARGLYRRTLRAKAVCITSRVSRLVK